MDPLAWPCPVWQSLSTLTQFVGLPAMDSWHKKSFTKKITAACSITSFFYTEHDVVLVIPSYSACSDTELYCSSYTFSPSSVPFVIGICMTFLWYFMQTPNWPSRHWDPNINLKTRVSIFLANCCMASSLAYDLRNNFSQTAAPHPPTNRPPEARKIHESKISAVLTCSFKTAFLDSKPFCWFQSLFY